jgi:serine/threonine-protein kinase TTK/MPS1
VGSAGPSSGVSSHDRSAVDRSVLDDENEHPEVPETVARTHAPSSYGSVSRHPSTAARSRAPEDNPNLQSSMRVKRVGKLPGSFLSGPARRGRRRQSEEDADGNGEGEPAISSQEPESQGDQMHGLSSYVDGIREFNSGSPISGTAGGRGLHRHYASNLDLRSGSVRPSPREREPEPELEAEPQKVARQEPAARPTMPSNFDQENEIPVSHKRTKPTAYEKLEDLPKRPLSVEVNHVRVASPERRPLVALTNNTPLRPAPPPPPKMSIVDTATSAAGAATTGQAKQRRNVIKVNGKCYTRLDVLGRGGSGKVYRVTAENGKTFALKRVSLEKADEATIRGFRGEIDLLTKLSSVERVVNLTDYEMNEERNMLTLVMEMGELDFAKYMGARQSAETAQLDTVFVRFYWKEMLECLQSVHQYDIVHSDLKPANFVLVKGCLKLIDFGIANAIQTDETVNVHRETQIGTPNYMSPESLLDSNSSSGPRMHGRPKLMKLGKPSDVWSLGCILYQMVYGLAPFGHIANPIARCQAIINWDHAIEYPSRGVGGVLVPPSLIRTMKRCLNRDQHMRPTCEELLHPTDPFLYPAEISDKGLPIDEEMLGRIIQSVVSRCRERMPTEAESLSVWPQAYWTSVKKAMAGRM